MTQNCIFIMNYYVHVYTYYNAVISRVVVGPARLPRRPGRHRREGREGVGGRIRTPGTRGHRGSQGAYRLHDETRVQSGLNISESVILTNSNNDTDLVGTIF